MEEFWALTPRETWMAIEARAWRLEQEMARTGELIGLAQKMLGWLAWHVAALQRSKRLPALARLTGGGGQTKVLTPDETRERKAEFERLKAIYGNRRHSGHRADPGPGGVGPTGRGPGGSQEEN